MTRDKGCQTRELPDCDEVFEWYFAALLSDKERGTRIYRATRPDVEECSTAEVTDEFPPWARGPYAEAVRNQIQGMLEAVEGDWPEYLPVSGTLDLTWIGAFDTYWTRDRVRALLERSPRGQDDTDLIITVIEFGVALGVMLQRLHPALLWIPESPYWESALFDRATGFRINVFHWAI